MGGPSICVLSGDNLLWQLLQITLHLGGTGFLPLGVGPEGESEPMSAPRSLPFWPLSRGLSVSS